MILYLILFFVLGSAVGSFLNVVVDRTIRGEGILGRSYCEYCRATLKTPDLIPIISFIALGARCRYCKKPLSWQYIAVEGVTAVLFTLAFWVLIAGNSFNIFNLLFWFVIISVLVVVATVDFKFSLIPTSFVYAISLISLFYVYFSFPSPVFIDHIIAAFGAALFFLLIVIVTFGRGMGQGDIVLAFFMGMVLGLRVTILSLFLAFLVGAVVSVILVVLGRKKFGNTIPFGPFLILGFFISLFWGEQILTYYFKMLY
ncbi:MAG: Type 4 prepilin-like protein leader peptide-processing enzyme [Candidatus Curtissbacteria bacterium GW2011_GWA1_40_9]|uniref:Type 4 prepilin-like protein leader peptide-processing enzyme n=1 Tax=Candidatus Curtissbacteria bacterium GW2011_GWA1_40_9 TaxID=1618408 RepID=A0A0G0TMN8_9BACT|nr:MAG: Type 4 prepilin-like protein leader peptide-processing enzyme [Candidatus Curtissbacteria bacterium GW2011_GWA1_40_9]